MNVTDVIFSPSVPWPIIAGLAALSGIALLLAIWYGLRGWALRALAALSLLAALAGPSLQQEERNPMSDILLVVVDDSASQGLSDRTTQTEAALADLEAQVAAREDLDLSLRFLSEFSVQTPSDDEDTRLMQAIAMALADLPRDRVAGVLTLSDGVVHDAQLSLKSPAPFHGLLSGRSRDLDLRLSVTQAPAFAILGEETEIRLRIDAEGAVPAGLEVVELGVSRSGERADPVIARIGEEVVLPLTLTHAGRNLIHVTLPVADGELTDRNNAVVVEVNGVRDRLRVLLVSGSPHPGTRTWRNLLKSDSALDLVHITILRPAEKQDGVPISELSLIAFPTEELFVQKIDEFDLIIFDRYKLRGFLQGAYLTSVKEYVERGGAILVSAGPSLASADSLARSALTDILPATPTGRLTEEAYKPTITDKGKRHPITRDLEAFAPEDGWGPWLRWVELEERAGHTILSGPEDGPLLSVSHVGEGRVALMASDHAWLWARGYKGGGPQLELLRRLAHWLMREPELEEEALLAEATPDGLNVTRRTMGETVPAARLTLPDGSEQEFVLTQEAPGLFNTDIQTGASGLFHVAQGELSTVVVRGASTLREFEQVVARPDLLGPVAKATNGTVRPMEDGLPTLRAVRAGRVAHGRGWLGYTPRGAYVTQAIRLIPLAPPWLMLLVAALSLVAAWLIEGRRGNRPSSQG